MKLTSNFLRSIILCGICLVTSCGLVQKTATSPSDGVAQENTTGVKRPLLNDPMQRHIPSALTKSYALLQAEIDAKKYDSVIGKLIKLQLEFPQEPGPSYRLARIYFEQQQYPAAITAAKASFDIFPSNYYALNLQAVALRELGEFAQAKALYLQAIQIFPSYPETHLNFAILCDIYLYELATALAHYEEYLALTNMEDQKVEGWIIDLKRRIER